MIRGDGPVEVVIGLSAGITIRGVTTIDRIESLNLVEQDTACAVFPTTSVIIGVD
jgi:molybdopterin-binding protein